MLFFKKKPKLNKAENLEKTFGVSLEKVTRLMSESFENKTDFEALKYFFENAGEREVMFLAGSYIVFLRYNYLSNKKEEKEKISYVG